jgi:DNA-binding LacI/PurR family transcriptional regulator
MTEKERVRTITDLAQLAGVSPGTVSRALADSPLISRKTRDLIQGLAREHDFRPNIMARNLRIKRTGAIGVVIPLGHDAAQHVSDPFFMTLIGHLADALTERGYDLLLSRVIPDGPNWLRHFTESGRVDGVILIGQSDQVAAIDRAAETYLPLVVWGANRTGQVHCSVGTNNAEGGRLAAQQLIDKGCRRIAFVGDPAPPEFADRLQGCKTAIDAAGLSEGFSLIPTTLSPDAVFATVRKWMRTNSPLPDGIVAESDVAAMATLRALAELGLSAPADIRITGFDDLSFAAQTTPPLTTVRQDLAAGASHLVDLLFRRIAGERTDSVILKPELVVRQSA